MVKKNITPTENGFKMPAEYQEHSQTWMLWPERNDIWRMGAKPAQTVFTKIANTIVEFEPVTMGVSNTQYENARNRLNTKVRIVELSYDDAWARDTGPTFLVNTKGELAGVDWFFDAWGGINRILDKNKSKFYHHMEGSYFPWKFDDMIARKILEIERAQRYRCPLILEGGAILVDGVGTAVLIKECILSRNKNVEIVQIEEIVKTYLGVKKVIWLDQGLYLEENNGHIDNMCFFVDEGKILLNWCDDKNDPQYKISNKAFEVLKNSTDALGNKLDIIKVCQPPTMYMMEEDTKGLDSSEYAIPRNANDRLPASYINSYICNGVVIIPSFASASNTKLKDYDQRAYDIFKHLFTDREVIQIPARELLLGGGGIHCIVQQEPKHI